MFWLRVCGTIRELHTGGEGRKKKEKEFLLAKSANRCTGSGLHD